MSRSARIGRRLDAAETLHTVVSTMKTLASVRIGQYRHAVAALEDSNRTIELALQTLLRNNPELLEAQGEREASSLALVVFGSDRGLCGPFNERVARHAHGLLAARAGPARDATLLAVGRRMVRRMGGLGWTVHGSVDPPGSLAAVEGAMMEVLRHVEDWRDEGRAERLFLVHAVRAAAAASGSVVAARVARSDLGLAPASRCLRGHARAASRPASAVGRARAGARFRGVTGQRERGASGGDGGGRAQRRGTDREPPKRVPRRSPERDHGRAARHPGGLSGGRRRLGFRVARVPRLSAPVEPSAEAPVADPLALGPHHGLHSIVPKQVVTSFVTTGANDAPVILACARDRSTPEPAGK